jgi:hypothetical protein
MQQTTDLRSVTPRGVADDIRSEWDDNQRAIPTIPGQRRPSTGPSVPPQPKGLVPVLVAA